MTLSIVVPCYNESSVLRMFYNEMKKVEEKIPEFKFEYILIDDGSSDTTIQVIKDLASRDVMVRYISFSRNFGKESAIYAGLEYSTGELIVTMDADLQDPPSLIPEMINAVFVDGYDCAATRRISREGEPKIRSFFARQFYKLMSAISDANIVDGARDFRLMSRPMVESVLSLKERNRFSKGIFSWVGFKVKWFEYKNVERAAGETKWSFWKLFVYSLDGIVAFSTLPLLLASLIGVLLFFVSLVLISIVIIKTIFWGDPVAGWPSLVCIITFIGGIQLLSIGILGQYLAKTYVELKNRPLFIVKEKK